MISTPRRNSPTETAAKYNICPVSVALSKKSITPELARPRLRDSLTTLASIKHMGCFDVGLLALEFFVAPDVGHRYENFRKASPPRLFQRLFQNAAMLLLGAVAVLACSRLQRLHQRVVQAANE